MFDSQLPLSNSNPWLFVYKGCSIISYRHKLRTLQLVLRNSEGNPLRQGALKTGM